MRIILRALVLSIAIMAATPGWAQDSRELFRYTQGVFIFLGGQEWVEKRDRDVDSHFTEVERTDDYIQMHDGERNIDVRLYADRGEWKSASSPQWQTWPGSEGRWR